MEFTRPGYGSGPIYESNDSHPPILPSNQLAAISSPKERAVSETSTSTIESYIWAQIPPWHPDYIEHILSSQPRPSSTHSPTRQSSQDSPLPSSLRNLLHPTPWPPINSKPVNKQRLADTPQPSQNPDHLQPSSQTKAGPKKREKFNGQELVALASAACEVDPWGAGYGQKAKAWEEVARRIRKHHPRLARLNRLTDTYKAKMKALLIWHSVYSCFLPFISCVLIPSRTVKMMIRLEPQQSSKERHRMAQMLGSVSGLYCWI